MGRSWQEMNMNKAGKPFWNAEPDAEKTSIRFCCPHCFTWVRNREFEEHLKLDHPELNQPDTFKQPKEAAS
jgi:hypothetical protein